LATGRIDLILWSHEPTTKILRGGRRKGNLGLPLGTGSGKASGAWTQNFSCQLPVSKHEQKVVIKMAASRPSRSEIGQVESSRVIKSLMKSIESIDKTAKSIVSSNSIDYGVC